MKSVMDDITAAEIPGCDIAVMKDNELVFRYAAGYSDLENKTPVKGDELYYLFSATKPITGAAAVLLMQEGKIKPDDEVGKYIPSFNDITVKNLLTMTAGLDYNLSSPELHALMAST
ncbi:MAG: beta-lactamase family protein [Clostridia bacterium]|nr:beta-lactamase family protein [Clostridia bacterium]